MLVLRSKPLEADEAVRAAPSTGTRLAAAIAFRRHSEQLRAAFLDRPVRLLEDDCLLAAYDDGGSPAGPTVASVRPHPETPVISRLETDGPVLQRALQAGYRAVASRLGPDSE